jgi:hypothetical protein
LSIFEYVEYGKDCKRANGILVDPENSPEKTLVIYKQSIGIVQEEGRGLVFFVAGLDIKYVKSSAF